jgi:hypothetical protein
VLQASSPSISLSELQSSFHSDNPDLERLVSGFRQQMHVQTLQEKLRKDFEQLEKVISVLKLQVTVPAPDGAVNMPEAGAEEQRSKWQRRLVSVFVCRRSSAPSMPPSPPSHQPFTDVCRIRFSRIFALCL